MWQTKKKTLYSKTIFLVDSTEINLQKYINYRFRISAQSLNFEHGVGTWIFEAIPFNKATADPSKSVRRHV